MKARKIFPFVVGSLFAVGILLVLQTSALSQDAGRSCQSALRTFFNNPPATTAITATLSMHSRNLSDHPRGIDAPLQAGTVEYGNGDLVGTRVLSGVLPGYVSTQPRITTCPPFTPSTGPLIISNSCIPQYDGPFGKSPQLTYSLEIRPNGAMRVGTLLNGHHFLGRQPVSFSGVCTANLITGVVGGKAYTINLKKRTVSEPFIH
jgi:hypothetical protein